jgi:hypothetical protein
MAASKPTPDAALASLHMPVRWMIGLAVLIVTPWIVVAILFFGPRWSGAPTPTPTSTTAAADGTVVAGPWGRLTLTPIVISPPLEYVPADWGRQGPPEWVFPGVPVAQLPQVLAGYGLGPEQLAVLARVTAPAPAVQGSVIQPPADLVRGLTPDVRRRLYPALAQHAENYDHAQAFRFIGTTTEAWLGGSLMAPETRRLVEPLVYQDGGFLYFADIEALRALVTSPEERQYMAKTLLRNSTVLMRLTIDSAEQVPALAEYWGRGGRRTDIRPLLDSIAEQASSRSIDVAHLLPSFPRSYLYRYPKISSGDLGRPLLANCLWSALNFFNATPDDRFLDVPYALEALRTRYYIVEHGFQLGDIVALVDDDGVLFHTAVHLAAGYVFTKNGASAVAPWTIMTVDQLKEFYKRRSANPRLLYHRPNAY